MTAPAALLCCRFLSTMATQDADANLRPQAKIAGCIDARGACALAALQCSWQALDNPRPSTDATKQGEATLLKRRERAAHSCGVAAWAHAPAERERRARAQRWHRAAAVTSAAIGAVAWVEMRPWSAAKEDADVR